VGWLSAIEQEINYFWICQLHRGFHSFILPKTRKIQPHLWAGALAEIGGYFTGFASPTGYRRTISGASINRRCGHLRANRSKRRHRRGGRATDVRERPGRGYSRFGFPLMMAAWIAST
jgi:hypothetical protein